ncbi:16S rRNA (guanine(966)-N(2))-methyltransferase RsmD [Lysobacter sp. LF1]|uniref:Ribosomal RNA small subunit methyltransferase D n=1 Tax=Lysobacter stagni TaxID=3045172 RepID=A0ABT6XKU1_9GAMM|nr:16S rRNA (guanine(966)-N(2))-methyltransferase RsmD [Lysobacter sp. LF1]MDI9240694.1 16S rRNA (guanine(966)-N(2))-methyltransferase RsmD [Lysobacter sp. LF1]
MNKPTPGRPRPGASNVEGKVRLIGGRWRGTRLSVPDAPGLRPTSDRVRETLFNWLMPMLPGARVLDLFAGSGALGLEALSRGAASAVLVERDATLAAALRAVAARLPGGEAASVVQGDALSWLATQPEGAYDLAFVDPPFAAGMWEAVLPQVTTRLRPDGWLYVEAPHEAAFALPADWRLHREGRTREVRYALYRRTP